MAFTIAYVTHADAEAAQSLTDYLLNKRLIACGNMFPIQSIYWWQGAISRDDEFVSLLKTSSARWPEVERAILEQHPYDVPCIMHLEVQANAGYEAWVEEMVG